MIDQDHHVAVRNDEQLVTQVITSAIDFGATNHTLANNSCAREWGQLVLNAAYEGTLRAAYDAGKKTVFLTLVGGGVFGNSLDSIFQAIERMKDFIENEESGLQVTLIWYKSKATANGAPSMTAHDEVAMRHKLVSLTTALGGSYTQYRADGKYRISQGKQKNQIG